MRSKVRYVIVLAVTLGFIYAASDGALAVHLSEHDHDHHHHDQHNECDREGDDRHDSDCCPTCQILAVFSNKIFVESPLLLPELSLTERSSAYSVTHTIYQHISFPVQPRAPPA